jgi:hemoglobin
LEQTLFEKYGGFSAISRIVLSLYDRFLDDDDIGPFFDDVELPKLIDHQTKFISAIMGGPATFSDTHIERAHVHLVITDLHFDKLKELVDETLTEFSIAAEDIEIVLAAFEERRPLIVRTVNVD